MLALADSEFLYYLGFSKNSDSGKYLIKLKKQRQIISGRSAPIEILEKELSAYFNKNLTAFNTPLAIPGTPFQKKVWELLVTIPFGKTISYSELAISVGKPSACRAVANANAANPFSVLIPCHRVIRHSGELGGYAGGVDRKKIFIAA